MHPYFEYVKNICFSKETKLLLRDYCLEHFHKFLYHEEDKSNLYLPPEYIPRHLMDEVGRRFKIPVYYEIISQREQPNYDIHTDTNVSGAPPRSTMMLFPIHPDLENFQGTSFFERIDDSDQFQKVCTVDYSLGMPAIINLQKFHSAINIGNDFRVGCQFTTDIAFSDYIKLYKAGELFE